MKVNLHKEPKAVSLLLGDVDRLVHRHPGHGLLHEGRHLDPDYVQNLRLFQLTTNLHRYISNNRAAARTAN